MLSQQSPNARNVWTFLKVFLKINSLKQIEMRFDQNLIWGRLHLRYVRWIMYHWRIFVTRWKYKQNEMFCSDHRKQHFAFIVITNISVRFQFTMILRLNWILDSFDVKTLYLVFNMFINLWSLKMFGEFIARIIQLEGDSFDSPEKLSSRHEVSTQVLVLI